LNTYKYVNDENIRIKSPAILSEETDEQIEVSWDEAISRTSSELNNLKGEILFIASPFSTLEDNYTLKKFAKEIFKSNDIVYIPNIDESFGDDLLKKLDRTPNSNGLKLLGIEPVTDKQIEELKDGKYKIIYLINDDIARIPEANKFLKKVDITILHLNIKNNFSDKATIIFPESTYAEINGTFINFQNRIQRIKPAVVTLEQERLIGEYSISRLDKFGAPNDSWSHGTRFNARPTWKILTKIAKSLGYEFNFENSEEVFIEMCNSIPAIKGWNYDTLGSKGKIIPD
jgi:NADH-quinone oxidoreductase subunit G